MLQASTGFKDLLLDAFPAIFNGGAIYIYAGVRPATSDEASISDPIAIITNFGAAWNPTATGYGLRFLRQGSYIVFDPTLSARITTLLGGTAVWWRLVAPGDTGEPSFTFARLDGNVGLKSAPSDPPEELLLDDLVFAPGDAVPLGFFLYTIPPIPGV